MKDKWPEFEVAYEGEARGYDVAGEGGGNRQGPDEGEKVAITPGYK